MCHLISFREIIVLILVSQKSATMDVLKKVETENDQSRTAITKDRRPLMHNAHSADLPITN